LTNYPYYCTLLTIYKEKETKCETDSLTSEELDALEKMWIGTFKKINEAYLEYTKMTTLEIAFKARLTTKASRTGLPLSYENILQNFTIVILI
jgi:hypothetical protein